MYLVPPRCIIIGVRTVRVLRSSATILLIIRLRNLGVRGVSRNRSCVIWADYNDSVEVFDSDGEHGNIVTGGQGGWRGWLVRNWLDGRVIRRTKRSTRNGAGTEHKCGWRGNGTYVAPPQQPAAVGRMTGRSTGRSPGDRASLIVRRETVRHRRWDRCAQSINVRGFTYPKPNTA